jgi:hypothetical protein
MNTCNMLALGTKPACSSNVGCATSKQAETTSAMQQACCTFLIVASHLVRCFTAWACNGTHKRSTCVLHCPFAGW